MARFLTICGVVWCVLWTGCAVEDAPTAGSPQNPPLPRTESILPLAIDNQWSYSHTYYDEDGGMVQPRASLDLEIPRVYGKAGSSLTRLGEHSYDWERDRTTYDEYVYAYEWEQEGRGSLVAYRDRDVAVRGLYLVGFYRRDSVALYPEAKLWLAYPATRGDSWVLDTSSSGTAPSTIEVVTTSASFYAPASENGDPSALRFFDGCYQYKETFADSTAYYYYREDVGAIGYTMYHDGRLRKSYILSSFRSGR
jgi:hypothetical protein